MFETIFNSWPDFGLYIFLQVVIFSIFWAILIYVIYLFGKNIGFRRLFKQTRTIAHLNYHKRLLQKRQEQLESCEPMDAPKYLSKVLKYVEQYHLKQQYKGLDDIGHILGLSESEIIALKKALYQNDEISFQQIKEPLKIFVKKEELTTKKELSNLA